MLVSFYAAGCHANAMEYNNKGTLLGVAAERVAAVLIAGDGWHRIAPGSVGVNISTAEGNIVVINVREPGDKAMAARVNAIVAVMIAP